MAIDDAANYMAYNIFMVLRVLKMKPQIDQSNQGGDEMEGVFNAEVFFPYEKLRDQKLLWRFHLMQSCEPAIK